MWQKYVIIDNSVQFENHKNKFTGLKYCGDNSEELSWSTDPTRAKLYESQVEAIEKARELDKVLPVILYYISIPVLARNQPVQLQVGEIPFRITTSPLSGYIKLD